MINKKKSQRWVKIVAWLLAISFGLGMTLLLAIPNTTSTTTPSSSNPASGQTPLTPITSGKDAAAAAIGQGDLALKSGNVDQAIGFYEAAYQLNKEDKAVQQKLGDAYYSQGQKAADTDKAKAKAAYQRYLQLLPDGPQAKQVKTALENL